MILSSVIRARKSGDIFVAIQYAVVRGHDGKTAIIICVVYPPVVGTMSLGTYWRCGADYGMSCSHYRYRFVHGLEWLSSACCFLTSLMAIGHRVGDRSAFCAGFGFFPTKRLRIIYFYDDYIHALWLTCTNSNWNDSGTRTTSLLVCYYSKCVRCVGMDKADSFIYCSSAHINTSCIPP